MDWTALVGTATGGVIGVAGGYFASRAQVRENAIAARRENNRLALADAVVAAAEALRASVEALDLADASARMTGTALADHDDVESWMEALSARLFVMWTHETRLRLHLAKEHQLVRAYMAGYSAIGRAQIRVRELTSDDLMPPDRNEVRNAINDCRTRAIDALEEAGGWSCGGPPVAAGPRVQRGAASPLALGPCLSLSLTSDGCVTARTIDGRKYRTTRSESLRRPDPGVS